MHRVVIAAVVVSVVAAVRHVAGQAGSAMDVVARAAEALGGRDRLLAIQTLTIEGYGQLAYQNGGGNITGSPDAPQKTIDLHDYSRVVDLRTWRMRVRQTQASDFVFATTRNMRGATATQVVDSSSPRRLEMYAHAVAIVRAALDPQAKVANRRSSGDAVLVDITVPSGGTLTLAVDATRYLPRWVSWTGSDGVLGDVLYRTSFTGYEPVSGVLMPMGLATTMDFRNVVQQKLWVDRHAIDLPAGDFPARTAPAAAPQRPAITATPIGKGVWFLSGGAGNSALFEFDDHLVLFEAYGNEASTLAVIQQARSLVPKKPLTQVIISHHHFDHTGGLRAAVSEGLTVVAARGNEGILGEVIRRPAKLAPDALERNRKELKLTLVDDHLKMKDNSMEIDIYRVIANSHMADALMVHVPRERLLAQGDLYDVNWEAYWWGSGYLDNVRYRKLTVERDVPVHGRMLPFAEVQQHIERQIQNAEKLCAEVAAAQLSMPGCPVKRTVDR